MGCWFLICHILLFWQLNVKLSSKNSIAKVYLFNKNFWRGMVQQWPARSRPTQAPQAHVTRKGCKSNLHAIGDEWPLCRTRRCRAKGDLWKQETLYEKDNTEICERLEHVESKILSVKEMYKTEDLSAMYFTVFCWSLRSGRVLDQSQQKCHFFFFAEIRISCKIFQLQPKKEFPSPFLWARSARKKFHHFPLKSSYFYRTSTPFWPSSSGFLFAIFASTN